MRENYSVLMSVYFKENPKWLSISIESMLKQTVTPEEFLIVKDGPLTPELDKVINAFANNYPLLFTIVTLDKNEGLGPALALGITKCRNELVIRMDSDDYSIPERCEKLLNISETYPDYGVIGSYEVEFEGNISNEIAIHRVPEAPIDIFKFMKRRCAILHPTVLYKKSVILECGNYQDVHLYEDYDLFMRMVLEHNVKCYNVQENLYYIRISDDFFKRRGGLKYLNTAVKFKWNQLNKGYISLKDFIISAGGQAAVCLFPNRLRKHFYLKFLR